VSWTLDGRPLGAVLVSRLRYLGDVVMSTVVLRALRAGDPRLRTGFLCEAAAGALLAAQPDLDRLHLLRTRRRGADARARAGLATDATALGATGLVRELRAARYDLAVDLFFNPRSAWLLRLGVGGARIGGARGPRRRLYTHQAAAPCGDAAFDRAAPGGLGAHLGRLTPLRHEPSGLAFRDWLVATQPAGLAPRLAPRPGARTRTAELLASAGVAPYAPYVLLAPGATWPAKAWPAARWVELLGRLPGPAAVLRPPTGADELAGRLDAAGRGASLLPVCGLATVLDLLAGAAQVVAVDGGVLHASVGLGRPVVGLFGPTDPELWFPYGGFGPYRVLCARPHCHPCDRHACPPEEFICLPAIGVDEVLELLT
jgi:ADP-heptose:LPS heptosyltransferase